MSIYKLYKLPKEGNFFLLFDNLLKVIREASIKHKFSFKNPYKDKKLLRYASHVACLHVLSACAGAQNPVSALNSNASSLPPLQCNHFVTETRLV